MVITAVLSCLFVLCDGASLLKRDLSGYELAKCNDGTLGAYYHDQDARAAGSKVLIYLPDGGDCSTVGDCRERCKKDPARCSSPSNPVLEQSDGIWSSNITENPFADYFKIFIHYCSSDSFAGTRGDSSSTGNIYFHGKHILTATLQDLVARFGIEKASSVVLAGSGSGGRGVGYNCDFVRTALRGVNPAVDVRCLADGPDFVPWWVKSGAQQCGGRDLDKMEAGKLLWGRMDDESCLEENEDVMSSSSLAHRCGIMSRYWQDIHTPLFIVSSQLDPVYFEHSPCTPDDEDAQYEDYRAAWRRGVVALAESIQASRPNMTSCFVPSCTSHTLLVGSLAQVYWDGVKVPAIQGEGKLSLRDMLDRWVRSDYQQAVDPLGQENSQCPSPSPLKTACGNLLGCATRTAGASRKTYYHPQSFNRRLLPPTSLFPTTYARKCSLDPWYGACNRRTVLSDHDVSFGAGHRSVLGTGHGVEHHSGHGTSLGARTVGLDTAGRRKRLWRTLYALQNLKNLYNKYKLAYAKEYHNTQVYPETRVVESRPVFVKEKTFPRILRPKRPRVVFSTRRVPSVVKVERPLLVSGPDVLASVSPPEYDYSQAEYDYAQADYDYAPVDYDYAAQDYDDYYDYAQGGCNTGCALSKIVRAVQLKKKNKATEETVRTGILASSVRKDGKLLKSFEEFLTETDLDFEDFGSLSSQVETFDKDFLKLQEKEERQRMLLQ